MNIITKYTWYETVPESIPEEPEMPLLKLLVGTSVWFEPQKHAKPKSAIQSSKFDFTKIFFDLISRWAIANFFVNVPWISILLIHFDVFIVSSQNASKLLWPLIHTVISVSATLSTCQNALFMSHNLWINPLCKCSTPLAIECAIFIHNSGVSVFSTK